VGTYLKLRGIVFSECLQPMMWPRPDVELLGVRYRRIPFLAIERDVYFDSRLIFEKMEQLIQHRPLGCSEPSQQAIQSLLEEWTESAFIFPAFATMPLDIPLLNDEKFIQDRKELWGINFSMETRAQNRAVGLVVTKANISLLENFLKDGRHWILGTESIRLADIHGE
jgi:glutathione S-transferase